MSVNTYPMQTTEPESYIYEVMLAGADTAAPTVTYGRGVTVTRTSAGLLTLTFAESPGPSFLGGSFGYYNATSTTVLGCTVCFGAYTAPASGAKATLVVTLGSKSDAAADIASGTTVALHLSFKLAAPTE